MQSNLSSVPNTGAELFRVLIVEDDPAMRHMLRVSTRAIPGTIIVGECVDGHEGVEAALRLEPDVILADIVMPRLDGIGMIKSLRAAGSKARILCLTSEASRDIVARAIEAGADGYILKGCTASDLRESISSLRNGGAPLEPTVARGVLDDLVGMMEEKHRRDRAVIMTLANAVEARDEGTGNHATNVARLGLELWREMAGSEPEDDLVYGFLLHDVGKISVPDSVLLKPGALTEEEWAMMRAHVELGTGLVAPLGFASIVTEVIQAHHERWDGGGYPRGLRGERIPAAARAFSVVDAFDAMTRDRPYRKAMSTEFALAELDRCAGEQFDPRCVIAFRAMLERIGEA